jgi:peroxiredoxin
MRKLPLGLGEPAPWFTCRSTSNEDYHFNSVGGRYVVISFFGSSADADSARVLAAFQANRGIFDDENACFFGVSTDPEDEKSGRVRESLPGMRYFWDFDRAVSGGFGLVPEEGGYRKATFLLDPRLRMMAYLPFGAEAENHWLRLAEILKRVPALGAPKVAEAPAPVLTVPYVFEPELCRHLIETYDRQGGGDSGFMRDVEGRTVGIVDHSFKRRRDILLEDPKLKQACMSRMHNRLSPEIRKAFQFHPTRLERYMVACYDAAEGGYFRAHRDNTTKGTAYRRFAVSLFLNTGEYDGGFLCFPEFGRQLYAAPVGGAVVFSCSLLHEATPVTRGCRYMFLPFLFDEEADRLRQENLRAQAPGDANLQ